VTPKEQFLDLVWEGYDFLGKKQTVQACDRWLQAWEIFKKLLPRKWGGRRLDLDLLYEEDDLSLVDWTSDLEMELHNAGLEDPIYYEHRVRYAREFLSMVPQEPSLYLQYRRAEGEALRKLGRLAEAEAVFEALVERLPDEGWAYIGWADNHWLSDVVVPEEYATAERILRLALARPNLVERGDVLERLADLYEQWGKPEQQAEAKAQARALERAEAQRPLAPASRSAPALPPKPILGRNDPCWCGSGKKYKHCHRKSDLGRA
jgi:tetratricopeptide (TPR) repeat protein